MQTRLVVNEKLQFSSKYVLGMTLGS